LVALVAVALEGLWMMVSSLGSMSARRVLNCGIGIVRMLRREWARWRERKRFLPRSISVSTMPRGKRSERASVTA
jgi:hypothetical protein